MTVALIPARGGSKRLPGKNMRRLRGRTLIEITVAMALSVDEIDETYVISDSPAIRAEGERAGAQSIVEPPHLAVDSRGAGDACLFAGNYLGLDDDDILVNLQACTPLRIRSDVTGPLAIVAGYEAEGCATVSPASPWIGILPSDMNMRDFLPHEWLVKNSQDIPKHYALNSICRVARWGYYVSLGGTDVGPRTVAYVVPKSRAIDIDTADEFLMAEKIAAPRRYAFQGEWLAEGYPI